MDFETRETRFQSLIQHLSHLSSLIGGFLNMKMRIKRGKIGIKLRRAGKAPTTLVHTWRCSGMAALTAKPYYFLDNLDKFNHLWSEVECLDICPIINFFDLQRIL